MGGGSNAGRRPRASEQALYEWAAADLGEPRLLGLIRDGLPAYAWTNDERHPWTPVRGRRLMPVLTWLTS